MGKYCNPSRQLNKGFTLVEIVVVIAIISVTMALGGYGISQIFDAQLDSDANELFIELRNAQYRSMSEMNKTYAVAVSYDSGTGRYGFKTYMYDGSESIVQEYTFKSHVMIEINIPTDASGDNWVDIKTLDTVGSRENFTIHFSAIDGSALMTDTQGQPIGTFTADFGTSQKAEFRISSTRANRLRVIETIQLTGRVTLINHDY